MPDSMLERLREASYPTPDGKNAVQYTSGGDTTRDASDLYAVLKETHSTGTSNLENDQVRQILTDLNNNKALDDAQWGVMKALMAKYSSQIAKLRASPDHHGQDYLKVAPEGTGRLVK